MGDMLFMNSILDALVKNLSNNHFKNVSQEFNGDLLKLVNKNKCIYMNIWTTLKRFLKITCLIGLTFLVL